LTAPRLHPRRRRWLAGAVVLMPALLALWLTLRPEHPAPEAWREFVPWCGANRSPISIQGELRERFLWLMSEAFARWKVEHIIRRGRIFTTGKGSFNGEPVSVLEIEDNAQWRVVSAIASGVTIDDAHFPPPSALIEEIRTSEQYFGPFPRRDEKGREILGSDPRFEDCELMRAAILKNP
jgi:hypothetical protein